MFVIGMAQCLLSVWHNDGRRSQMGPVTVQRADGAAEACEKKSNSRREFDGESGARGWNRKMLWAGSCPAHTHLARKASIQSR